MDEILLSDPSFSFWFPRNDSPSGSGNLGGSGTVPNADTSSDLFVTDNVIPLATPEAFIGSTDFKEVATVISAPIKAVGSAVSSAYESVKSTVKSSFLYFTGGVLLVGVVIIIVLAMGNKLAGKIGG